MTDIFEEAERMAREEADRYDRHLAKPEVQAAIAKRKAEQFARGVQLGWWDADGNPIEQADEDEDEDEDEDD